MSSCSVKFTGEFFVPGMTDERIYQDHFARYQFASNYVRGKSVLDIACGFGYAGPVLVKAGATEYLGVDINSSLIQNAIETYKDHRIKYLLGDICLFRSDKTFDIITCFETIEHVPEYRNALLNLRKLLNPGGKLIISSPNRIITSPDSKCLSDKPSNKYHSQEFTVDELKEELTNAGFDTSLDCIYGQRMQFNVRNKFICRVRDKLFGDPCVTSSALVSKIARKHPRYIVMIVDKK